MSKIQEVLKDKNAVLVFDVDGVLAAFEYGDYNHNACKESEWSDYIKSHNVYEEARPLRTIQEWLIENANTDRLFVCTAADHEFEFQKKVFFVEENYPIRMEQMYMVHSKKGKLDVLNEIHRKYFPELDSRMIVMVDDSVDVLTHIQENSDYSTAHVSSFVD